MLNHIMQRASAGNFLNLGDVITPPDPNGLAGPGTTGCRIPRAQLIKTTSTEATQLTDLSGRLIMGKLVINQPDVIGTDFIVEARSDHTNLIEVLTGGNSATFTHLTVSGLELDYDDQPVRAHEINAAGTGPRLSLTRAEIMYVNDGFRIASGCSLVESYIHTHTTDYSSSGEEQHRDGAQSTRGGLIRVEDNLFDNRAGPCPFPDGTWIGTYSKAASSSMITNHDAPYTGWVKYNRNRSIGGVSVHVNLIGGVDPGAITDWWVPVYDINGELQAGFECLNNISLLDPDIETIRLNRHYRYYGLLDASNIRIDPDGNQQPWTWIYSDPPPNNEYKPYITNSNDETILYKQDISMSGSNIFSLKFVDGTVTKAAYYVGNTDIKIGESTTGSEAQIDFSGVQLSEIPYGIMSIRCDYEYTDSTGVTKTNDLLKSIKVIE